MNALLSFRHPLSETWTEVELEAETLRKIKHRATSHITAQKLLCLKGGDWKSEYSARHGDEYSKTFSYWPKKHLQLSGEVRMKTLVRANEHKRNYVFGH